MSLEQLNIKAGVTSPQLPRTTREDSAFAGSLECNANHAVGLLFYCGSDYPIGIQEK